MRDKKNKIYFIYDHDHSFEMKIIKLRSTHNGSRDYNSKFIECDCNDSTYRRNRFN